MENASIVFLSVAVAGGLFPALDYPLFYSHRFMVSGIGI